MPAHISFWDIIFIIEIHSGRVKLKSGVDILIRHALSLGLPQSLVFPIILIPCIQSAVTTLWMGDTMRGDLSQKLYTFCDRIELVKSFD